MDQNWQDIEEMYRSAYREMSREQPAAITRKNLGDYNFSDFTRTELLQLAYDKVEQEMEEIRSELRLLREKHRVEEDRLERRLIQKTALRKKILAQADQPS